MSRGSEFEHHSLEPEIKSKKTDSLFKLTKRTLDITVVSSSATDNTLVCVCIFEPSDNITVYVILMVASETWTNNHRIRQGLRNMHDFPMETCKNPFFFRTTKSGFQLWFEENKSSLMEKYVDVDEADYTVMAAKTYKQLPAEVKQVSY